MRVVLYAVVLSPRLLVLGALAGPAALDQIGQPFYSPNIRVEWELKTNPLPAHVRIFKLIPATMPDTVISNLMRLGGFSEKDRIHVDPVGSVIPNATLAYRSADDRSGLSITPSQGSADLYAPQLSTAMPEEVPDQARATQLGTNLLRVLQIPADQLLMQDANHLRTWFYPGTETRRAPSGKLVTRPRTMGIDFRRHFDGIPCFQERCHMQFESHEKLTQLEVRWHSVQPSAPCPVASTQQIGAWIKEGRARVQSLEVAGPGGRRLQPADIKRINIREIAPHYTAASYFVPNELEAKSATHLFPYAMLTAEAELGPDDKETIYLFVPITPEALTAPSRQNKKYGFAIYQSTFYDKQREKELREESK